MKNKLKGAETGHSLLKRKSEALTKYFLPIHLQGRANVASDVFEVCCSQMYTLSLMAKVSRNNKAD